MYPKIDRRARETGSLPAEGVLGAIVARKRAEVAALRSRSSELRAQASDADPPRAFAGSLRREGEVRLLAEVKRRSPSAGWIAEGADAVAVALGYEAAGAGALSVLTDADGFGGSLDDLRAVRSAVRIPVLRKDFVVDPLQVWEARASGADAVLLILRILEDGIYGELAGLAAELGMSVLCEAHGEVEADRGLALGATLLGINNRDLDTFRTDLELSIRVAPRIRSDVTLVAESGIRTPADVDRLGEAGVDAILVGESLMRTADPGGAAAALVARPRSAGVRR
jgi:indole-3-glycerol phosphate synthase